MSKYYNRNLAIQAQQLEEQSDRRISKDIGYIVALSYNGQDQCEISKEMTAMCKEWLFKWRPSLCYVYQNELYMYFSPREELEHEFFGSHQKICSFYSSEASQYFSKYSAYNISCKIIEIDCRLTAYTYLFVITSRNYMKTIERLTNKKLKYQTLEQMTLKEIISQAASFGIKLAEISDKQKYGTFMRIDFKAKECTMKELDGNLDFNKYEQQLEFLIPQE